MVRRVAASLLLLALAAPPAAAETAPAPSVLGAPVVVGLTGNEIETDVHLVVGNDGGPGTVTIRLIETSTGRSLPIRLAAEAAFQESVQVSLQAYAPSTVNLRVSTGRSAVAGQVVVQPAAAKAAAAAFETERRPEGTWMALTLLGFVASMVLVLVTWLAPSDKQARWSDPVLVDANWSFSTSWATNITGITAALGAVLAATQFVGDVLPGVSLTWFVGMNVFYGVAAAAAAAVFRMGPAPKAASGTGSPAGSVGGLLAAAWLVLGAALGQVGVLVVMAELADAGVVSVLADIVLGLVGVLLAGYVVVTTYRTVTPPDRTDGNAKETTTYRRFAALP